MGLASQGSQRDGKRGMATSSHLVTAPMGPVLAEWGLPEKQETALGSDTSLRLPLVAACRNVLDNPCWIEWGRLVNAWASGSGLTGSPGHQESRIQIKQKIKPLLIPN